MSDLANIYDDVKNIICNAREKAYRSINSEMVKSYWLIGKRIFEEEQSGKDRIQYGSHMLNFLSEQLTHEFGQGFSIQSLKNFRQFFRTFPDFSISSTVWSQLSWSHYKIIMRVESNETRMWYLKEASEQMWSVRTLTRNVSSQCYERLLLSQTKDLVKAEMNIKSSKNKLEFIKNPSVLEFLGLPPNLGYTEAVLEKAIINNLQKFILELGKGFAFIEQQHLIRTETTDYFIDLVFYNYILKCFVLIDLKTSKISHQDIGQMDMYVRMYDELRRSKDDNPSIGIVLCSETDQDIAKYSILKGNENLFATKYKLYLPTEAELRAEIEKEKEILNLQYDDLMNESLV
jgi:predicted nuclease of restriction endonuclease-like (RecB) superfamily